MKRSFSIFVLAIGCGALSCRVAHAVTVDQAITQQQARPSDQHQGPSRVSEKGQSHVGENSAKPGVPKPPANGRARSTSAAATKVHPPALNRSSGAANAVVTRRQAGGKSSSVQPRAVPRPSEASPVTTRHHSSNPARVGGTTTFRAATTGALNGTGISRRP
jgi:hypothetical protein